MNTTKFRFAEQDEQPIPERKALMRAYMKARRGENENRDIKASLLLQNFKTLFFSDWMGAGTRRNYFVYLSFSSEAPTDELITFLMEQGQRVFCPRIDGKEMTAVEFGDDFTISQMGIREPVGEPFTGEIDVIVFPLLAVDKKGNRLGYGGGYYDRFAKKYPSAKRIALAYDFQLVHRVPCEQGDERVQAVVTDAQTIFTI